MSYTFLQHYWWAIISLLGGILVFLMFVQGGQSVMYQLARGSATARNTIGFSLGRKWGLTFTTLVTFGGAFFASFPLFYSTSFGGAFYVWMAILLVFVIQAVGYEFRDKPGNFLGERTFGAFLQINGLLGPLLIGTAVGTLFTGAQFTVERANLGVMGGFNTVSEWTTPWRGLDAVADYRNVLLGVAVLLLARVLGLQYLINDVDDAEIRERARKMMGGNAAGFVICFVAFVGALMCSTGLTVLENGGIVPERFKYLHNLLEMPVVAAIFVAGVLAVLWGIWIGWRHASRRAIWFSGAGTILAVFALLLLAGWNATAYYPSLADPDDSLTIFNSSSSYFTLATMSWVSLAVPLVVAYIWWVWRALSRKPVTAEEVRSDEFCYAEKFAR